MELANCDRMARVGEEHLDHMGLGNRGHWQEIEDGVVGQTEEGHLDRALEDREDQDEQEKKDVA
jgi:hypothetical protein